MSIQEKRGARKQGANNSFFLVFQEVKNNVSPQHSFSAVWEEALEIAQKSNC